MFEKGTNINFNQNPISGNRVVSYGQTDGWNHERTDGQRDRHNETNSRYLQFCERAKKTVVAHRVLYNLLTMELYGENISDVTDHSSWKTVVKQN
jgi:hypothetical protein